MKKNMLCARERRRRVMVLTMAFAVGAATAEATHAAALCDRQLDVTASKPLAQVNEANLRAAMTSASDCESPLLPLGCEDCDLVVAPHGTALAAHTNKLQSHASLCLRWQDGLQRTWMEARNRLCGLANRSQSPIAPDPCDADPVTARGCSQSTTPRQWPPVDPSPLLFNVSRLVGPPAHASSTEVATWRDSAWHAISQNFAFASEADRAVALDLFWHDHAQDLLPERRRQLELLPSPAQDIVASLLRDGYARASRAARLGRCERLFARGGAAGCCRRREARQRGDSWAL